MIDLFPDLGSLVAMVILLMVPSRMALAESTSSALSRMDHVAQSFTGATADMRAIFHTAVINDDETENGTVIVKRVSAGKMNLLIAFNGDSGRAIALRDQIVEIYYPKLNTIQEYDIRKYRDTAQKLILLGFGTSGGELAANYNIENLGVENVGSQSTTHLVLVPKSPEVVRQLERVELWISEKTSFAVQQKFYMPDGDYRLVTYSSLRINPTLSSSALDLPRLAKRIRMK